MTSPGGNRQEYLNKEKSVDAASPGMANHQRINDILLGKAERRLLRWFCVRMPSWVTPDMLTMLALLAGIATAAGYALTNISKMYVWISSLGLVLHWFGDSLDGSLARYRKIERPRYGYFLDHSLDTLAEVLIALGIGLSPYVRLDLVLFALIAYLMMSVSVNIRTFASGVFQISYGKFGPTELRAVLIIANTIFYFIDIPVIGHLYGPIRFPDLIAIAITIFLVAAFMVTTLTVALKLRRNDDDNRP
jgi:phosphatidylglycerophosphate synthase